MDGNRSLSACAAVMQELFGIDISAHRARRFGPDIHAEIILAMDPDVARQARALGVQGDIQLIGDYAGSPGEIVDDPYGGAEQDYRACAQQIRRLVVAVADRLEAASSSSGP